MYLTHGVELNLEPPTAVQSAVHFFIQTLLIFTVLRVEIVPNVTLHVPGSPAMHQPSVK